MYPCVLKITKIPNDLFLTIILIIMITSYSIFPGVIILNWNKLLQLTNNNFLL